MSDLPTTISRKYAYADDPASMYADGDWQAVEGALSKDKATLGEHLQTWKLKLSTTKKASAVFHHNNKKANFNKETLPFSEPKYLRVALDRSLTYCRHLESLHKKLTSRIALLSRFVGSSWDAGATTLQTATLALVHLTTEYCAPVWCRSPHIHLIAPPSMTHQQQQHTCGALGGVPM